jgi:hypothetical protein
VAPTSFAARGFRFDINTGTTDVPVKTRIKGINSWTHTPSSTDASTTDFDSVDGAEEHFKILRGETFALTGQTKLDKATGGRDPGQEAVETLAQQVEEDSLKEFWITWPGGTVWECLVSAEVQIAGGDNANPSGWSATLIRSGPRTVTPPEPED